MITVSNLFADLLQTALRQLTHQIDGDRSRRDDSASPRAARQILDAQPKLSGNRM
jgi:hypothetical protein